MLVESGQSLRTKFNHATAMVLRAPYLEVGTHRLQSMIVEERRRDMRRRYVEKSVNLVIGHRARPS
jgi:hypothetical protein